MGGGSSQLNPKQVDDYVRNHAKKVHSTATVAALKTRTATLDTLTSPGAGAVQATSTVGRGLAQGVEDKLRNLRESGVDDLRKGAATAADSLAGLGGAVGKEMTERIDQARAAVDSLEEREREIQRWIEEKLKRAPTFALMVPWEPLEGPEREAKEREALISQKEKAVVRGLQVVAVADTTFRNEPRRLWLFKVRKGFAPLSLKGEACAGSAYVKVLSHLCESFKNAICPEAHWEGPCKWPLHDEPLYKAIIASQFTKQEVPYWKQLLNFLRVIPPESGDKSLEWHLFRQYGGDVAFVFAWTNTYICGLWFLMVPLVILFNLAPGDEFHQPTKYWLTGCQIWVCFWAQILIMFHSLQTGMLNSESMPQAAIKAMRAKATLVVDIWKKETEVDPDPDSPPPDGAAVQDAGAARPNSRQSGAGLHRIADLRATAQGRRPGSADSQASRRPRRESALTEEQAASILQRNLRHLKLRKKFQAAVDALSSSQMKAAKWGDKGAPNPDYAPRDLSAIAKIPDPAWQVTISKLTAMSLDALKVSDAAASMYIEVSGRSRPEEAKVRWNIVEGTIEEPTSDWQEEKLVLYDHHGYNVKVRSCGDDSEIADATSVLYLASQGETSATIRLHGELGKTRSPTTLTLIFKGPLGHRPDAHHYACPCQYAHNVMKMPVGQSRICPSAVPDAAKIVGCKHRHDLSQHEITQWTKWWEGELKKKEDRWTVVANILTACVCMTVFILAQLVLFAFVQLNAYIIFVWGECEHYEGCSSPQEHRPFLQAFIVEVSSDIGLAIMLDVILGELCKFLGALLSKESNFRSHLDTRQREVFVGLLIEILSKVGYYSTVALLIVPEWLTDQGLRLGPEAGRTCNGYPDYEVCKAFMGCGGEEGCCEAMVMCLSARLTYEKRRDLFLKSLRGPFVSSPFIRLIPTVIVPLLLRSLGRMADKGADDGGAGRPRPFRSCFGGLIRLLALIFAYDCSSVGGPSYVVQGSPFGPPLWREIDDDEEEDDDEDDRKELVKEALNQVTLKEFNPLDELTELKMNFAFVVMLAPVYPMGLVSTLIARWVEIRVKMGKLFLVRRRHIPEDGALVQSTQSGFLFVMAHVIVFWHVALARLTFGGEGLAERVQNGGWPFFGGAEGWGVAILDVIVWSVLVLLLVLVSAWIFEKFVCPVLMATLRKSHAVSKAGYGKVARARATVKRQMSSSRVTPAVQGS